MSIRFSSYSWPSRCVVHRHGAGLDRDAPLALQVHVVEQLLVHLALADGAGVFQQPVGQRALAVVDVGDDAEVADVRKSIGHEGRSRDAEFEVESDDSLTS